MKRLMIVGFLLNFQLDYAAQDREVKTQHAILCATGCIISATVGCALFDTFYKKHVQGIHVDDEAFVYMTNYVSAGCVLYAMKLGSTAYQLIDELKNEADDNHQDQLIGEEDDLNFIHEAIAHHQNFDQRINFAVKRKLFHDEKVRH